MSTPIEKIDGTSIDEHPYRFFGAFRLVLALGVLISHASGFLGNFVQELSLGNVGVMLFFVVSGAVIFEALDVFYRTSSTRFLINRALKIFPAYWAALIIFYGVLSATGSGDLRTDPWALIVNFLLLPSYLPSGNNLLLISVAWAIVIEFQFYFIAAILCAIARRTRMPSHVLYAAGAVALAFYLFICVTNGHQRFYGGFAFAPYFVLGGAIYYSYTRHDRRAMLLGIISFILSVHAYIVYNSRPMIPSFDWTAMAAWPNGLKISTLLFVMGICTFTWLISRRFGASAERMDKRLGDITYAIYLVHSATIMVIVALHVAGRFGDMAAYALTLLISIVLAILIHRGVERPIMRLRNIFRGQRLYD